MVEMHAIAVSDINDKYLPKYEKQLIDIAKKNNNYMIDTKNEAAAAIELMSGSRPALDNAPSQIKNYYRDNFQSLNGSAWQRSQIDKYRFEKVQTVRDGYGYGTKGYYKITPAAQKLIDQGAMTPPPPKGPDRWETGEYKNDPYYKELNAPGESAADLMKKYNLYDFRKEPMRLFADQFGALGRAALGEYLDAAGVKSPVSLPGLYNTASKLHNPNDLSLGPSIINLIVGNTLLRVTTVFESAIRGIMGTQLGIMDDAFKMTDEGFRKLGAGDPEETAKYPPRSDFFDDQEKQLGGIQMEVPSFEIKDLGNLKGAVYDQTSGTLVLIGDKNLLVPQLDKHDLAWALFYFGTYYKCKIQFSIDPINPGNPDERWQKCNYYPEMGVVGSQMARTLFETDWLLKQYAMGVQFDGDWKDNKQLERKCDISGYESIPTRILNRPVSPENVMRARQWIILDTVYVNRDDQSLFIKDSHTWVNARRTKVDANGQLVDDQVANNEIPAEFAKWFSRAYTQISQEEPEFDRLRQLHKSLALAKWLIQNNLPCDRKWVEENCIWNVPTWEKVTRLGASWTQTRVVGNMIKTRQVSISGGVDEDVIFKDVKGEDANQVKQLVSEKMLSGKKGPFDFEIENKSYLAIPISLKSGNTVTRDNLSYHFNSKGKVDRLTNESGKEIQYEYSEDRLTGISAKDNGWILKGTRNTDNTVTWSITASIGNSIIAEYNKAGYLTNSQLVFK